MATAGIVSVKLLTVYKGSDVYACATDASFEISNNLREILCKDTGGYKEFKGGSYEWTMSVTGLFAFDHTEGGKDLVADLITGLPITIRFSTEVSNDTYWEGSALVQNVSINSSGGDNENVTYSATFQGTGALTTSTIAP